MVFHQITPFFEPAVRSVLDQTCRDLELVLVDNGTGLGLAPLGETGRDPRIRLLALPENRGIAAGHNHAVAQARSEYIALLDYDDIALPNRIERQVAYLEAHPDVGLVSSEADTIDEHGRVVGREFSLLQARDQAVYTQFATPVVTPAYAGRREVLERFLFRTQLSCAEDYDFLARAAEVYPMCGIPEVLFQYRRYPQQTTVVRRAALTVNECVIRLLTARRRAGRDEEFDLLVAEMSAWLETPPPLSELYATFGQRFLDEGLTMMAVYHARRLLSVRHDPRGLWTALRIFQGAVRRTTRQAPLLINLFLRGPVRAYGLKDHPARR
jgi:glycosyltransferase involved in cell wall biosynthesis